MIYYNDLVIALFGWHGDFVCGGCIFMQHDFRYVDKNKVKVLKKEVIKLINEVQDEVRDCFTFRYDFVGSCCRNMVTYDAKGNTGFDFDVNIQVNDDEEQYSAKEIKQILMRGFSQICRRYGYSYPEDSTRVLTIKVKDKQNSRILHSCDFAIVYNCDDGRQQYIRFNKKQNCYEWVYQGKGFIDLPNRIDWLKRNNLWSELKEYYIEKKNNNTNSNKHSRSIFAESVNEMCNWNGYFG